MKAMKFDDKETIALLKKEFRLRQISQIVMVIMLLIFSLVVTAIFIKIGDKYNNQFLMGIIDFAFLNGVGKVFMGAVVNRSNEKLLNIILQFDEEDREKNGINLEDDIK